MARPLIPPYSIASTVERWSPGVYVRFWTGLVEALRYEPVRVSSYWRDPARNRAVGGSPDSQHLLGLGVDLVFPSPEQARRGASAVRSRGLIAVHEGDHVHVQAWPAGVARASGLLRALGL